MATDAKELATMLALLRNADQHDSDAVKQARADYAEATSEAIGWQRAAEEAQNRFIVAANQITELSQHAESLAQQLEASQQSVKIAKDVANDLSHRLGQAREERDQLSELLAKANEQLDGGKNQPIEGTFAYAVDAQRERQRLLGTVADIQRCGDEHGDVLCTLMDGHSGDHRHAPYGARWENQLDPADIHPDEDPHDHAYERCTATAKDDAAVQMRQCDLAKHDTGPHGWGTGLSRLQWF